MAAQSTLSPPPTAIAAVQRGPLLSMLSRIANTAVVQRLRKRPLLLLLVSVLLSLSLRTSLWSLLGLAKASKTKDGAAKKEVPRPDNWPFFGAFFFLSKYGVAGKTHVYFKLLTDRYGPIFQMRAPILKLISPGAHLHDMVIVSDAEAAKQILNNTVDFSRNPFFQNVGKGLSDYALFTIPSGNMWKKHRKLLQPAFGPSHLRHAAIATSEVVADIAADLNRRIGEAAAAGKPAATVINMYEYMTALTMDVIGKVAFSHEFESVKTIHSQQSSETRTKIEDIFNIICVRTYLPPFAWNWSDVGLKSPRPVAVRQCTYSFVKQILDERRVSSNNGANITKSKWEMDVLDRLLQNNATAKSSADVLSEEEIIGEILGFFLAGHETTAHTLTFLMLALCQNPPVMRKLVDEIDAVYEQVDGKVTNENLSHFKYLDWVVKETQRKYNVVNHILRHSNKAVEVGGYSFPANTPFIVNTLDLHNNPTYWPSPESFRPERWAEPPISGSYMPFGDGPTVCVGMKMASIEIRVATIFLLRQFRFEMVEGQTIDVITTVTTGLKHGLQVRITERKADEPRSVVAAAAN